MNFHGILRTVIQRKIEIFIVTVLVVLFILQASLNYSLLNELNNGERMKINIETEISKKYNYNRQSPMIFIGGIPRSGTTLMRAILDVHPEVRCGLETRILPVIIDLGYFWRNYTKPGQELSQAGITEELLISALAAFSLEIIARHDEPAHRLCDKDPLLMLVASFVVDLFPNSKFLFMVRDGRAVVHSIFSNNVSISGFDSNDYEGSLHQWNLLSVVMQHQCSLLGNRCFRVYYEELVLHPKETIEKVLKFLELPWNYRVLNHEKFINESNGVRLSQFEKASSKITRPVNPDSLDNWVGHIPPNTTSEVLKQIAPMLSMFGYNIYQKIPNYEEIHPNIVTTFDISKEKTNVTKWQAQMDEIIMSVDLNLI